MLANNQLAGEGQPKAESGALAGFAASADAAAMFVDDAFANGEAKAGAIFFGGEKRFEEPLQIFLGNTHAGVGDFNEQLTLARGGIFHLGGGEG